ncbi:hypothetical protein EYF80_059565 [Liparis tanakae]|uniref:Uncharacterized protein n=1 Tax=Liparis tanakae TaxID=230148 RepID=A0A4Z2EPF8_9TELE|nr:hypothetical protein EYF80_059565 [Liparis tanakae]
MKYSHLVFLSWSRIFFSISASVSVSSRGHHWSASPVLRMAISTVGRGFSLQETRAAAESDHQATRPPDHQTPRPPGQTEWKKTSETHLDEDPVVRCSSWRNPGSLVLQTHLDEDPLVRCSSWRNPGSLVLQTHLDDDPLVRLLLQDPVRGVGLDLLADGGGDGGDEGQRVQVQVVTQNLCEHLRGHQLLCGRSGGLQKGLSVWTTTPRGLLPFMFHVKASRSFWPSISMSRRIGTSDSSWAAFSWITAGSWSSKLRHDHVSHHRGKVLFLSRPMRLRLMVVEHGTASRWWELLGSVGTH